MNTIKEISRINQRQLDLPDGASWHDQYKDSAYIYIGGLPYDLTEGDVVCIFSQYGEPLDINLIRDKNTGKSKGFAFLKYEDQRSTVLAVDNLSGTTVLGRTLRVDHVSEYHQPKREGESTDLEDPRAAMNVAPEAMLSKTDVAISKTDELDEDVLAEGLDPEDPMRGYLIEKRRKELRSEKRARKKCERMSRSEKHGDESRGEKHGDESRSEKHGDDKPERKRSKRDSRSRSPHHRSRSPRKV
ncbi:U2 snRNP component ist3 [Neolecta irregularis DAH-3]|uniref:U2 snRNP component ist3 n=1 Tax=Neolecta irregularis (strain DAH-3) TaxID=1198029 RepID=A0A1U7LGY4_NEOID|nr:U2 snRNP component ist3 [Neolecta irregularis DAH-3]|eukprot:OLL21920.1 U2 snRNP component ist3 [Neolecta irregularis DAH-3]